MSRLPLILQLALGAVVVYAAWCALLYALQDRLVFPRAPADPAAQPPDGAEVWHLATSQGPVEAWYFAPSGHRASPAPAVLIAHGNAELIDTFPEEFRRFRDLGMAVLQIEYPGYGRSPGQPSQTAIAETSTAAYDRLVARPDVDGDRIILFGRSLGGGTVCDLSRQRPAAALILLSTFQSLGAMTARYLAPPFLVRHPFDNLAAVSAFPGPVLILHSDRDPLIPYRHAVALSHAARHGILRTLDDCGHADCPQDWDGFWHDVTAFLDDHLRTD
ncbi:alpha/beta hydrolase [Candidatus Latescibacterota bacterium]